MLYMAAIEDFISRFHNLDGITIGEKQRSFRKLISDNTAYLQDLNAVDIIVKKITPKTHLEDLLKLQILLHCRKVPELVDIFTGGNEILISKIIKHDWFIKKVCQDKDAQQITNDLLPRLSYSVRMKVLKRISLYLNNDDKVYSIFEAVKERYSLRVAMPLVLGCSVPRIEFIIKHNAISFKGGELKHFIKKSPELLPLYMEEYNKHYRNVSFIHNNDLLRYIASVDYDVFCHLKEKYKFNVNYGKRASRKLFVQRKEEILDNLSYYENHLSRSIFVRKLVKYGYFRKYILDSFCRKVEDFSYDAHSKIYKLLQYYPRNKQFQLLEQSFEEVYRIPLVDCPEQITKSILDMVSDVNKREKMVENKIQSDYLDNVEYMIYFSTSKSIPFIKKEIDLSGNNIARRNQLIKALVDTCKINDDWNALKELLKYILARHRNDEVLKKFLPLLAQNFNIHEFTRDLWDIISELINIYILKEGNLHDIVNILLAHLEFRYNSGGSLTDLLLHYMKNNNAIVFNLFSYSCKNCAYIQALVPLMINLLPRVYEDDDVQYYSCYLIEPVLKWNKEHQAHAIPIEDQVKVLDALKKKLEEGSYYYDLKLLICREHRNDKILEMTSLYWEKHLRDSDIVLYFLKWYPTVSRDYTESLTRALCTFSHYEVNKIFKWIRKYDHIQLPENILKCSIKLMEEENQDNQHMVEYLSHLMNPEDYVNFVDKYKPKKLSVDIMNEQEKDIHKLQFQIIKGFSNLCSPIVLPHVLDYCGGDFLKFALVPLYRCFYRIPEEKLNPLFNRLVKNSVSVRKHAVFLAVQICTRETVKNILKSAYEMEKNPSLQKRLILTSFNVLKQIASDDFWELFRDTLTLIDVNDKSTFELLIGVSYVPIKYRLRYFEEIWNLIGKPGLPESNRYRFRSDLANNMKPYVEDLPPTFCIKVIEILFLKFSRNLDCYINHPINDFIFKFLLHHEDLERFNKIYGTLMNAEISSFYDPKLKSKTYIEIMTFITTFINSFLSLGFSKDWNQDLLRDFIQKLSRIYPELEFFETYVSLSLINILIDLNGATIKEYALKVSEFCQSILDKYGPYVIDCLESNIIHTLQYFEKTLEPKTVKVNFINEFLKISKNELDYVIAFKVFTQCCEDKDKYKNIIDIFKACNYFCIQYMLREKDIFSVYK